MSEPLFVVAVNRFVGPSRPPATVHCVFEDYTGMSRGVGASLDAFRHDLGRSASSPVRILASLASLAHPETSRSDLARSLDASPPLNFQGPR